MSDGQTHHRVWRRNLLLVPPLTVITYLATDGLGVICFTKFCLSASVIISAGVPTGYLMGRYIDPDLDQMGTTAAEGRLVNEIPILGHFLYGHWSTYGSIFRKHHRSIITHFPVLSTIIRIIYQFYPLFILIWAKEWFHISIPLFFFGILIGLSFADFLHWYKDVTSGEL